MVVTDGGFVNMSDVLRIRNDPSASYGEFTPIGVTGTSSFIVVNV